MCLYVSFPWYVSSVYSLLVIKPSSSNLPHHSGLQRFSQEVNHLKVAFLEEFCPLFLSPTRKGYAVLRLQPKTESLLFFEESIHQASTRYKSSGLSLPSPSGVATVTLHSFIFLYGFLFNFCGLSIFLAFFEAKCSNTSRWLKVVYDWAFVVVMGFVFILTQFFSGGSKR